MDDSENPICRFYRLIPEAPLPRRADISADGMLPTRGYRYCAVSGMASAFGWYIYPPIDFSLVWTGTSVIWTYDGAEDWYPLRRVQYPGFRDYFRRNAPEGMARLAPTFLAASRDLAMVQIWSGYLARTAPGWALLSRAPVNIPISQPYEHYEGIFQSEFWFGPLFINIRLTQQNVPVEFERRYPLLQAQPLRHECYHEPSFATHEFGDLTADDWQALETTMGSNTDSTRKLGHHAVEVRKRLRAFAAATDTGRAAAGGGCPFPHAEQGSAGVAAE